MVRRSVNLIIAIAACLAITVSTSSATAQELLGFWALEGTDYDADVIDSTGNGLDEVVVFSGVLSAEQIWNAANLAVKSDDAPPVNPDGLDGNGQFAKLWVGDANGSSEPGVAGEHEGQNTVDFAAGSATWSLEVRPRRLCIRWFPS